MKTQSYKDLIVWQQSMELIKEMYRLTALFPKGEMFGIIIQMRRAAVSIPSNIAEGYGRRSPKEYQQFYSISYGSALELETQLCIARELDFAKPNEFALSEKLLNEVVRMLYVLTYGKKGVETIQRPAFN